MTLETVVLKLCEVLPDIPALKLSPAEKQRLEDYLVTVYVTLQTAQEDKECQQPNSLI